MKTLFRIVGFAVIYIFAAHTFLSAQIRLHPQNAHYFEYNGEPLILIASSEHYGAVINKKFDYKKYLSVLKKTGLNHTRIFLGDYVESKGAFCIETNTLNPEAASFVCPWKRSVEPGYALGGNKFDLDRWNDDYFARLHDFMKTAEKNGIIVEAVLFFASYTLEYSPLFYKNNINGVTPIKANQYMTLNSGNLLKRQEDYCRKLVRELNRYDNLIINVANEPWFDNQEHPGFVSPPPKATREWIRQVSQWIIQTEAQLPKKHLISVDYVNEGIDISREDLDNYYGNISVFNHHYDRNAQSVRLNYYKADKAFSFNETGLMPSKTPQYRIQGWKYIFSGGALYNNLDFTFQVGHEDGSGTTDFSCEWYSGCTDPRLKFQLANLLKFMKGLNFIRMKPDYQAVALNYGNENIYPLIWAGHQYAVYFEGGCKAKIKLNIPNGIWTVEWLNPADLKTVQKEDYKVDENFMELIGPQYKEDILLFVEKKR